MGFTCPIFSISLGMTLFGWPYTPSMDIFLFGYGSKTLAPDEPQKKIKIAGKWMFIPGSSN